MSNISNYIIRYLLIFVISHLLSLLYYLQSLELLESSSELRQRLLSNTRAFRSGLQRGGLTVGGDDHPICPVMVGEAAAAVDLAAGMLGD